MKGHAWLWMGCVDRCLELTKGDVLLVVVCVDGQWVLTKGCVLLQQHLQFSPAKIEK